jgi:O-succinylbenzoate synthase
MIKLKNIDMPLYPSVSFAIEQALLYFCIKKRPMILRKFFRMTTDSFSTPVNALIILNADTLNDLKTIANTLIKDGYSTVKLKVGRFSIEQEAKFIRELYLHLGDQCKIRLDGNRLFSKETFLKFSEAIQEVPIEYIEEPLIEAISSRELYDNSPIPVALDESLQNYIIEFKSGHSLPHSVNAFVVKPTTIGGIHETVKMINFCHQVGLKCVLSSAFDSGWTLSTYALLSQLSQSATAMGLDTYKYLATDVLNEKLNYSHGKLTILKEINYLTLIKCLFGFSVLNMSAINISPSIL